MTLSSESRRARRAAKAVLRTREGREAYGIAVLNRVDQFAPLRNGLRRLGADRKEWAGIPMPLEGHQLVVEPTYPKAAELAAIGAPMPADQAEETIRVRGRFWSVSKRADVVIFEKDGRVDWGVDRGPSPAAMALQTLGASVAWGIEQEKRAIDLLGTLVRHHTFKQYLLTGMFIETSARSGVTYLFRRLRPTVAIRLEGEHSRILCTLCLHPIAYYAGSWAGAMCPTDDLVAHLMLMRGDEVMFWRRANQHPAWRRESGL